MRTHLAFLSMVLLCAGCSGGDDETAESTPPGQGGAAGTSGKGGAGQAGAGQAGASGQAGAGQAGASGQAGAGQAGASGQAGKSGSSGQGGAGQAGASGQGGSAGATPEDPTEGAWSGDFGLPGLTGDGAQARALVRAPGGDLFVGGVFAWVDGVAVKNVARWDGTQWHAMGEGLPFTVRAMALDEKGTLFAGGGFGDEPGVHLARWKNDAWESLPDFVGNVEALVAAPGGGVLVGGSIAKAGAVSDQLVVRYDDKGWTGLGPGDVSGGAHVSALVSVPGGVCAGGLFESIGGVAASNVGCWDGSTWAATGEGLPGEVLRLTRLADGTLYAGGTFTFIVDPNTGAYVASMGRYDAIKKSWAPFEGVDGGFINTVRAITPEADGSLVIGGEFGSAGPQGEPARSLARYKDGSWSEVGGGVRPKLGAFLPSATGVYEVLAGEDGLYVAGFFSEVGNRSAVSVARISPAGEVVPLKSAAARHLGLDAIADALLVDGQGRLVVGGAFSRAGDVESPGVARWKGDGWEPLGPGLGGMVRVLGEVQGELWAGGELWILGKDEGTSVARFDGQWYTVGPALDGPVFAFSVDEAGRAVIGGDFTAQDGAPLGHVAAWNGSTWESLGAGLDGRVTSLARGPGGKLYAGGLFGGSGSAKMRGLAVFEGGAWKDVGGSLDGEFDYVSTLSIDADGRLVVGGQFASIGGVKASSLARWDGAAFEPLGLQLDTGFDGLLPIVSTALPAGKGVLVGGVFSSAGGVALNQLGWLGPQGWKPLGKGLGDLPEAFALRGNELWAGGPFVTAGGKPSCNVARFDIAP